MNGTSVGEVYNTTTALADGRFVLPFSDVPLSGGSKVRFSTDQRYVVQARALNSFGSSTFSDGELINDLDTTLVFGITDTVRSISLSQPNFGTTNEMRSLVLLVRVQNLLSAGVTQIQYSLNRGPWTAFDSNYFDGDDMSSQTFQTDDQWDGQMILPNAVKGKINTVKVRFLNSEGHVGQFEPTASLRLKGSPYAPVISTAQPSGSRIEVMYRPGPYSGSEVTSVQYQVKPHWLEWDSTEWVDLGAVAPLTDALDSYYSISTAEFAATGSGYAYDIRIREVNAYGPGDESNTIELVSFD